MAKATMTLNMTGPEMVALNELSDKTGMSKTAVMRQALKIYQMIHRRLESGERMMFSGDQQRAIEFVGIGFPEVAPPPRGTK